MMGEHDQPQDDRDLQAPESLVRALKELERERIFVPPSVDDAVLSKTRDYLQSIRPHLQGETPPARLAPQGAVALERRSPTRRVSGFADRAGSETGAPVRGSAAARRSSRPLPFRALAPWAALAASIALAAWLIHTLPKFRSIPTPGHMVNREEFIPNGQVDIFDAFALARRLQSGQKPDTRWDFNGDGVVDGRDVEAMARQAVKLAKGGHS